MTEEARYDELNNRIKELEKELAISKFQSNSLKDILPEVTDFNKAIKSLIADSKLFEALMDNFPHPIYFKDKETRFTRINKAQAVLLGIENQNEAIGQTDFDFFTRQQAQEAFGDEQKILISGEQLLEKMEQVRNAVGDNIWVSTTKIPVRNNEDEITGLVGISINVNDKILEEKKSKEICEKAIKSDRLKSVFLANMSHEIRTPMNGIIGFSNLLKNNGISREQQNEYLGFIEKCGNSLLNLIDDIIDVSKIEAGQLVIRESKTYVNDVLRELFVTFDKNRIAENKKAVELRLVIPENMGYLSILTDPLRLRQILSNLVGNALKFTEKGFIEFGYSIGNKEIEFYVKDSGVGIPKDKFNMIFERFGQVMENERLNSKGTGLGLAICLNIVKLLGGKMWLESEVGRGSKFCFTLPFKSETLTYEEIKPALTVKNNFDWVGKKLLVVDDDQINWIYLRELITPTQAQLVWAKNGKEAVEIYEKDSTIDMILMDFRMPVMNGYDATKIIRGFDQKVPIIALTAYAQEEEKELFLQAGCNAFLNKPVQNGQLFKMLNHFLMN